MTIMTSLPWYFWVLWGTIGFFVVLRWTVMSTKNDPIFWRLGWVLGTGVLIVVTLINLEEVPSIGKNELYSIFLSVVNPLSELLLGLMFLFFAIGGYQKFHRTDFDQSKRREIMICMYVLLATVIFLIIVFGGVYIYSHFIKNNL